MKRASLLLMIMFLTAAGCSPKPEVNLLSMGDIAQVGPGQARVAATLERHVRASPRTYDALFTAGDNFYMKLTGVDDPKWQTLFEELYNPAVLSFPFYIALGNHDYDKLEGGGFKWEIEMAYSRANPGSRWKLPAKWYRVELPAGDKPLVTVLVLDSYKTGLGETAWAEQLAWLEAELARPRKSAWLVAVAHHPLFSNGDHGDNGVLQRELGPLLEKGGVDFYIAGHDHDLQHLEMPGWRSSFLLVGGGGARTRPMRRDTRGPFSRSSHGFADLNLRGDRATVRYIGVEGEVLHAFERTTAGRVKVIQTTASDRAVPRKVRDVTRPGATTRTTTTRSATTRATSDTQPTTAATRP